jgi:pimeloyl-ACP methyl ester carboxylesterase
MGGAVIAEAANRLTGVTLGLVGIDTWSFIDRPRTSAEVTATLKPLRGNFTEGMNALMAEMFSPLSKPKLVLSIRRMMHTTHTADAINMLEKYRNHDLTVKQLLLNLNIPKFAINSTSTLTQEEAERFGIHLTRMDNTSHFPMLERPRRFNRLLGQAVQLIRNRKATGLG